MRPKHVPILLIAAASLAAAGLAIRRAWRPYGDNDANNPDGIAYICDECGHEFVMTVQQRSDHQRDHWGEPVPCPKCGGAKVSPADRCPHCGKLYHRTREMQTRCPLCGEPLGP